MTVPNTALYLIFVLLYRLRCKMHLSASVRSETVPLFKSAGIRATADWRSCSKPLSLTPHLKNETGALPVFHIGYNKVRRNGVVSDFGCIVLLHDFSSNVRYKHMPRGKVLIRTL